MQVELEEEAPGDRPDSHRCLLVSEKPVEAALSPQPALPLAGSTGLSWEEFPGCPAER